MPVDWDDQATTTTWTNATTSDIIRVIAVDADARIVISATGATSGDGVFMLKGVPEYFHIPIGHKVYVSWATVNFSPCK